MIRTLEQGIEEPSKQTPGLVLNSIPATNESARMGAQGNSRPLTLWTDVSAVPGPLLGLLWPFYGGEDAPSDPRKGRFHGYRRAARHLFHFAPLQHADYALLPVDYGRLMDTPWLRERAQAFVDRNTAAGKETLVFHWHDSWAPLPLAGGSLIFRTSVRRSVRRANEWILPTWSEDFVAKYAQGQLPIRHKRRNPKVGFCGRAAPLHLGRMALMKRIARKHLKRMWGNPMQYPYLELRTKAMQALMRAPGIDTDFEVSFEFWGGATDLGKERHTRQRQQARSRFVRNMFDCEYVLCIRGAGNFSMRFYETLSTGRIPVLVDTDMELPFRSEIDWQKLVVSVMPGRINALPAAIQSHYQSFSDKEFGQLQREIRSTWLKWLSPVGWFAHLRHGLLKRLDGSQGANVTLNL